MHLISGSTDQEIQSPRREKYHPTIPEGETDMPLPLTNIGLVLVLGVFYLVAGWQFSKRVQGSSGFILGGGKLGVAFGMTSILAFWITANTMLAAPEAAYNYGIAGVLGYALAGSGGVVLLGVLSNRITNVIPNGNTIGDFYGSRYDSKNYIWFLILLSIYVLGLIVTQGIGGGVLLEAIFGIPYYISVTLTFLISITYAYFGGFRSIAGVAYFQALLILVAAIVVPPLVYFNVGIEPVYNSMLEQSPQKLSLSSPNALLFIFATILVFTGEVFMDNTFWQRIFAIRRDVVVRTFLLSGIGWLMIPFAVASLAFVALAFGHQPEQVNQVAPLIAEIYGGQVAKWLFLVAVWSGLLSTTAGSINSLSALFMNDVIPRFKEDIADEELFQIGQYLTILIGILGFLLSLPQITTLLQLLIFLGVINAAFLFPIVAGLWWEKTNPHATFIATILGPLIGYWIYFTIGTLQGVVASGWISFLLTYGLSLIWPSDFDWATFQEASTVTQSPLDSEGD